MISAGMRTGEVHAHTDGDRAHDHAAQLADGLSNRDDAPGGLDPANTVVLHAHDVGTTVSTLPTLPVVALSALGIGSASCRERVCQYVLISVVAVSLKKKK